jgi:hypothetical protein
VKNIDGWWGHGTGAARMLDAGKCTAHWGREGGAGGCKPFDV